MHAAWVMLEGKHKVGAPVNLGGKLGGSKWCGGTEMQANGFRSKGCDERCATKGFQRFRYRVLLPSCFGWCLCEAHYPWLFRKVVVVVMLGAIGSAWVLVGHLIHMNVSISRKGRWKG